MSAAPDVNVEDITHLDFVPPCSVRDCDDDGAWVLIWRPAAYIGCCQPWSIVCRPHVDFILSGVRLGVTTRCAHGIEAGRVGDLLDRIELL
jgi:hypothetical protein